MNWEEIYKLPLRSVEGLHSWINSSNGVHALDIFAYNELCESLVRLLNGEEAEFDKEHEFIVREGNISCDGKLLMRVKGWGYLTGRGDLNLSVEKVTKIQDEFINYIIEKLNHTPIRTSSSNQATEN